MKSDFKGNFKGIGYGYNTPAAVVNKACVFHYIREFNDLNITSAYNILHAFSRFCNPLIHRG